jgi:hypothetical protein
MTPERRIAQLAADAHAVCRRDLPAESDLARMLAAAACHALLVARASEARPARRAPKPPNVFALRPNLRAGRALPNPDRLEIHK